LRKLKDLEGISTSGIVDTAGWRNIIKGEAPWEFDPETGEQINPPNPDYEVEP